MTKQLDAQKPVQADNAPKPGSDAPNADAERAEDLGTPEQLSQNVNGLSDTRKVDNQLDTSALVNENVLPATEIDLFGDESLAKPKQSAESPEVAMEKIANAIDVEREDQMGTPDRFYNISNPEQFTKDMTQTAKDLIAAGNDKELLKTVFEDAAAKFSRENPKAAGQTFAFGLGEALSKGGKDPSMLVWYKGSEDYREGTMTVDLIKNRTDGSNRADVLGSAAHKFSNGATPAEMDAMTDRLGKLLPNESAEFSGPDSLRQIVKTTNDIIKANGLGEDVKPLFDKAGAEIKANNPNASSETIAKLLNYSLKMNPQVSTLFFGADKGEVKLLNRVPEGSKVVSKF